MDTNMNLHRSFYLWELFPNKQSPGIRDHDCIYILLHGKNLFETSYSHFCSRHDV